jgi:hypothetical protein
MKAEVSPRVGILGGRYGIAGVQVPHAVAEWGKPTEAHVSVFSMSTVHAGTAWSRSRPIVANAGVIAGLITGLTGIFADTARAQVPTVNIQKTCRAAATAMVSLGSAGSERDEEICLKSENDARERIIKDWSSFEASDRKDCVQPNVYLPSYIEWLTCFEMNKNVREMRQRGQSMAPVLPTGRDGYMTLPRVRNGNVVN